MKIYLKKVHLISEALFEVLCNLDNPKLCEKIVENVELKIENIDLKVRVNK